MFGVAATLSMAYGCTIIETQKVESYTKFTLKETLKKKDYLHSLLAAHPYHYCRCSPNNSDDEEEEDVDDKEGGEMGTTGLVLGHSDKSKDESDD